jgi:hypothetical protein
LYELSTKRFRLKSILSNLLIDRSAARPLTFTVMNSA